MGIAQGARHRGGSDTAGLRDSREGDMPRMAALGHDHERSDLQIDWQQLCQYCIDSGPDTSRSLSSEHAGLHRVGTIIEPRVHHIYREVTPALQFREPSMETK
ncbi:hypothetical protein GCM10027414_21090 [Humibacter ginsengiterrae]